MNRVGATSASLPLRRFVWQLERYRFWLHIADSALWAAAEGIPLLTGLVLRRAFDAVSGQAPVALGLPALLALLLALAASRVALYVAGVFVDLTYRYHLRTLLRRNVLDHLLRRPAAGALPAPVGDVVNRLYEDAGQSEEIVVQLQFQVVKAVNAAVAIAVLVRVNARVALVAVVPIVLAAVLAQLAGSRLRRYRAASRQSTGRVTTALGEVFSAVQAVQAAGKENAVVEHVQGLNDARLRMALADVLFGQLVAAVQGNTVTIATGVMLLLAGQSIRAGTFTVGDLALFMAYLDWLTEFARGLGSYVVQFRQQAVSVQRLVGLLPDAPPDVLVQHAPIWLGGAPPELIVVPRGEGDHLHTLAISGVTCRYGASGGGIEDVSFTAPRGTLTVVTGRVGSGKSTLLRALLGLAPGGAGISGEIRWNGRVVADPGSFFVPTRCAYVPQAPHLFSDTLQRNVLLGLPDPGVDLDGALRLAAMQRDLAAMPHGLATQVGPRGLKLSGGQVQRTAAARAFVREAELLVIDDLTSALDVETERALWDSLKERAIRTGLTIIAASHRRLAFEHADQIVLLKSGSVAACGTLAQVMGNCDEMRALWEGGSASNAPSGA